MKLFQHKHLNNSGIAHYLVPLLVVLLVSIIGTFLLVASHADSSLDVIQSNEDQIGYDTDQISDDIIARQEALPEDLQIEITDSPLLPMVSQPRSSTPVATTAKNKLKSMHKRSTVVAKSQKIADSFWHDVSDRSRCSKSRRGGHVKIYYVALADDKADAYTYLNGRNPHKKSRDCTIYINRNHYATRINGYKAWDLCDVLVHEYGHLYGYDHSKNKKNIMYKTPGFLNRCYNAL